MTAERSDRMTTPETLRDALVKDYHERMHDTDCSCPADFIAKPIDAIIAAVRAEAHVETERLRALADRWDELADAYLSRGRLHRGAWYRSAASELRAALAPPVAPDRTAEVEP